MNNKRNLYSLIIAALLIAVGLILPFFLGQVQILAQGISPMHIPALIAGLTLGPVYGLAVGFITPLLRFVMFGMPALPVAVPMAFELAAYAIITGLLYPMMLRTLKTKNHLPAIIVSMLIAMVLGRLVGGAAKAVFMGVTNGEYSMKAFVSAYFLGTWIGAILHLIIVPIVVLTLEKLHLSPLRMAMRKN